MVSASARTNTQLCDHLLTEHGELRALIGACERVAREILAGATTVRPLLARVVDLLEAVEEHNDSEEAALRPLLLEVDCFGQVRIDQMIDDHLAEHSWLRQILREAVEIEVPDRAARAALDAMQLLREHMSEEEAEFLNKRVLKDDLIPIDASTE